MTLRPLGWSARNSQPDSRMWSTLLGNVTSRWRGLMALAGTANARGEHATTKIAIRATLTVASRRVQRPVRRDVNVICFHGDTRERVLRASWETQRSTARNPPRTAADKMMTAQRPHHHWAEASVE